ncbi:MAG: hypothetical protein COZ59_11965, partial [Bacteroidetes bacterium CG_4_8_14_3_um_filter_31_14]
MRNFKILVLAFLICSNIIGQTVFSPEQIISSSQNAPISPYCADIDGDNLKDVIAASWSDDNICWYKNIGNGTFSNA